MEIFFAQLISGLCKSMYLFLVAAGFSLIYGVSHFLNIAHASFYMLGAYLVLALVLIFPQGSLLHYVLAVIVATMLIIVLAGAFELLLFRRVYQRGLVWVILMTFGLTFVFVDIIRIIWGTSILGMPRPVALLGSVTIFGQTIPNYSLPILVIGPLMGLGLWFLVNRTHLGLLLRAAVMDGEMLGALGINVSRLTTLVFVLGTGLAGLGGGLVTPMLALNPYMAGYLLIPMFAVVVIGGFGSIPGAMVAALIIGLVESFGLLVWPGISIILIFALMAVVLIVRPHGLFGRD